MISAGDKVHQIATVRRREKMSLITLAKKMGMSKREVAALEDEYSDISVSMLHCFANGLKVPVSELLVDDDDWQSPFIQGRSMLVRMMKTVEALRMACSETNQSPLVNTLRNQLIAVMPELVGVRPGPQYGSARGSDLLGKIALMPVPDPPLNSDVG